MGRTDFSDQFREIIIPYKYIGYNLNVIRQSACLVCNQNTINNYASFFICTPLGWASDSMMAQLKAFHFSWLGLELFRLLLGPPGINCSSFTMQTEQLTVHADFASSLAGFCMVWLMNFRFVRVFFCFKSF